LCDWLVEKDDETAQALDDLARWESIARDSIKYGLKKDAEVERLVQWLVEKDAEIARLEARLRDVADGETYYETWRKWRDRAEEAEAEVERLRGGAGVAG
jgi:hypothetical protein